MSTQPPIHFFFEKKDFRLDKRQSLKQFLHTLFRKEDKKLVSLNYIFCSDKRLLEINRQFLNHDYYTDIITFNLSGGKSIEGEVYISIDRVRDNARTLGISFKQELHRVIFHGALHLCGYRDKKPAEIRKMREMENHCLSVYFK